MDKKYDVFLSYSREDKHTMNQVWNALNKSGLSVWVDTDRIASGQDWREEIQEAISLSRILVVLLSPPAVKSNFVTYEIQLASHKNIRIIPFVIAGHPGDTIYVIPPELIRHNYILARDEHFRSGLFKLIVETTEITENQMLTIPMEYIDIDLLEFSENYVISGQFGRQTQELDHLKSHHEKQIQQLQEQIAELESENEQFQTMWSNRKDHLSSIKQEISSATERYNELQHKFEEVARERNILLDKLMAYEKAEESANKQDQDIVQTNILKLNPWSPLDWLRLLWWLLVDPKQYTRYEKKFGVPSLVSATQVGTLAFGAFFIPVVATVLNWNPSTELSVLSNISITFLLGLIVPLWIIAILIEYTSGYFLVTMSLIGCFYSFFVLMRLNLEIFGSITLMTSLGILFMISRGNIKFFVGAVSFGAFVGFGTQFMIIVPNAAIGAIGGLLIPFIFSAILGISSSYINHRIHHEETVQYGFVLLFLLCVSFILLIYIYWFGGWQVLA